MDKISSGSCSHYFFRGVIFGEHVCRRSRKRGDRKSLRRHAGIAQSE